MQLQEPVTPRVSAIHSSPLAKTAPAAVTARLVVRPDESVALDLALEDTVSVSDGDVLTPEKSQVSHQIRHVMLTFQMCVQNKVIVHASTWSLLVPFSACNCVWSISISANSAFFLEEQLLGRSLNYLWHGFQLENKGPVKPTVLHDEADYLWPLA